MTVFIGESMSSALASLPGKGWSSPAILSAFSRSLTLSALRAALCFVMIVISCGPGSNGARVTRE